MSSNHLGELAGDSNLLGSVDYPGGFYREQAPAHLNLMCAINGVRGPNLDQPYSYCELGCGSGETTAILAAANPRGTFFGIDLSQSHIESATALASTGELDNVHFVSADIARLDASRLPEFDFITMHGLYAWVPVHVQEAIRQFVEVKLKIGGVVYVTYNALPGWGAVTPLRRFFVETAAHLSGDPVSRVREVVEILSDMRERGAPFFEENPTAGGVLTRLIKADPRYIAHEFLSESWTPRYFGDVNAEFAACGLDFVGDGSAIENIVTHSVAPGLLHRAQDKANRLEREVFCDFVQNRFFRRDVYHKPTVGQARASFESTARDMYFGFMAPPVQIPATVKAPNGSDITFSGEWYERIKHLLGYKVLTLGELVADPVLQTLPTDELITNLKLLCGADVLAAFIEREAHVDAQPCDTVRVIPQLNNVRLAMFNWSHPSFTLASPTSGAGVALNGLEVALLSALQRPAPIDWALPKLADHGVVLNDADGCEIQGQEACRAALTQVMDEFKQHKLPKLAYMGIVACG